MPCTIEAPCGGPLVLDQAVLKATGRKIWRCRNGHTLPVDPPPTLPPGQAPRGVVNGVTRDRSGKFAPGGDGAGPITVSPAASPRSSITLRAPGVTVRPAEDLEDE